MSRVGHNAGYPETNILHVPTADWNKNEPARKPIYREDYDLVDAIAQEVIKLPDFRDRSALVAFWGAYPSAAKTRAERYIECSIPASTCKRRAKEAMKWIKRRVE